MGSNLTDALLRASPQWFALVDGEGFCWSLSPPWRTALVVGDGQLSLPVDDLFAGRDVAARAQVDAALKGDASEGVSARLRLPSGAVRSSLTIWPFVIERRRHVAIHATFGPPQGTAAERRFLRRRGDLVENVLVGLIGLDCSGLVTFMNRAAERLVGLTAGVSVGYPIHDLLEHAPADGDRYSRESCPIYAGCSGARTTLSQTDVFRSVADGGTGRERWLDFSVAPFGDAMSAGAVLALRDVSHAIRDGERRRRELELVGRREQLLAREVRFLRRGLRDGDAVACLAGRSAVGQRLRAQVEAASAATANLLIEGELGSGRSAIAEEVHFAGARAGGPFIAVRCHEADETELLGRGGAGEGGLVELASRGALFLEDVDRLGASAQAKLRRVLVRLASGEGAGVRVIASTRRSGTDAAQTGELNEDLYYHLAVLRVSVPPLRTRLDDLGAIARVLLEAVCVEFERGPFTLERRHVDALRDHPWRGNLRELRGVLERVVIASDGDRLRFDLVLPKLRALPATRDAVDEVVSDAEFREREKVNVEAALIRAGWRVSGVGGAAELLGLKPTTLAYRMKTLGIRKPTKG